MLHFATGRIVAGGLDVGASGGATVDPSVGTETGAGANAGSV